MASSTVTPPWNPDTGESTDGRTPEQLPTRRVIAFAWQDDHGPDEFFEPTD